MKTLLTILAFFSCTFLFAQEHVNHVDSQGRKQGKWIYYGKDRPEKGMHHDSIVEEGHYVDDRKEGVWVHTRPDGTKIKGEYQNNRPKTNCTSVRTDRFEKATFDRNHYVDSLVRIYPHSGTREYEAFYNENGQEEGRVNYYFQNQQLEFTYIAKNGMPVDTAYRYYENGDLKEIIIYAEDGMIKTAQQFEPKNPLPKKPIESTTPEKLPEVPNTRDQPWNPNGYNKVYNSDNEIWQDGTFKNGLLCNGKEYFYDEDGILLKVRIFKAHLYDGEGQK